MPGAVVRNWRRNPNARNNEGRGSSIPGRRHLLWGVRAIRVDCRFHPGWGIDDSSILLTLYSAWDKPFRGAGPAGVFPFCVGLFPASQAP